MVFVHLIYIMLVSVNIHDVGLKSHAWCDYIFLMIYKVEDNAYDLFVSLLGLFRVMELHIHIELVDLDWGYE